MPPNSTASPRHVAVIPDGNRRFGVKAATSVRDAYRLGARKGAEFIDWTIEHDIPHLSAFGISAENFTRRPGSEVEWVLEAIVEFCEEASRRPDVRLHIIGDFHDLRAAAAKSLTSMAARSTLHAACLTVHVAVNYSTRFELEGLVKAIRQHGPDAIATDPSAHVSSAGIPPIDLVIRTGGQQRLSGFLPLQAAYAELYFTDVLWPDFRRKHFDLALAWYAAQERRAGE